jgi:HAD superfamily hydrolase (TIGR01509 family)
MDGLLIDSEPFWKNAEKEVYARMGVHVSDEFLRQVEGVRLDEAIAFVHLHYPFTGKTFPEVENEIISIMAQLIVEGGKALPGVYNTLEMIRSKNMPMALASSSPMILIDAVMRKLQLDDYFSLKHSAQFEPYGKPHPGIFIKTANDLNIPPVHCLVFEDSLNGILAAKAARMTCIAVPDQHRYNDLRVSIADIKLSSLSEFNWEMVEALSSKHSQ